MSISYLACMALVASIYNLPPRVLPAIQAVEGGVNGSIHQNANGSEDFGVMQINTVWASALSKYTRRPPAYVEAALRNAPCYNIAAAGAILRAYLDESGGNLMLAIGDYHSHTPVLNHAYQTQVISRALQIFGHAHSLSGAPKTVVDR